MKLKKKPINLLKMMLKNSYDMSNYIDEETKKINKKSSKVWALWIVTFVVIYISYALLNFLKEIGAQPIFLGLFFFVMQMMIIFQSTMMCGNIFFFSEDNKNYLYMPISTIELIISKFGVVFSINIGLTSLIFGPAVLLYGIRTIQPLPFFVLLPIVIILITFAYSLVISIITIIITRIFGFIKNKKTYQQIVTTLMTILSFIPFLYFIQILNNAIQIEGIISQQTIEKLQKLIPITNIGIEALSKLNWISVIDIFKLIGICIGIFIIFLIIGKVLYLKNVLNINSILVKNRKNNYKKKMTNKKSNKYIAYIVNEFKIIIKSQTYFINYIYKIVVILAIFLLTILSLAQVIEKIYENSVANWEYEEDLGYENSGELVDFNLNFERFSMIIGMIQILFTFSTSSLTAISRCGKNAIFMKYIPIKESIQFLLKLLPGILINTITVIVVCIASNKIFEISALYNIGIIIIGMLLNIINCCILLFIDLWRPQLKFENEITIIKQNENNILKYILTIVICFILWYLKEVTKKLDMNKSILIEILVFIVIISIICYVVIKKKNNLLKKIN